MQCVSKFVHTTGWYSHISGWGLLGRCIMPFLLLVLHSLRTPLLFILRDCGLMRNDESREAGEWVGIHMLHSTGNPILSVHAHTSLHKHTLVFMSHCHQPQKKPYSPNVQCPLSVNISSIPTLMWQNITRAQNSEELLCNKALPAPTVPHHVAQLACWKFGNSGWLNRL